MRRFWLTLIAVLIFVGYVTSNQLMQIWNPPAVMLETALDRQIPFFPPAEFIYISVYLFLFMPVVQVKDMRVFERVAYGYYLYNTLALVIFFCWPVRYDRPEFAIDSLTTWGVAFNYAYDPPYNNFPSLHVSNAVFAACVAWRLDRPVGWVAGILAAAIAVSTLLVKQHWIADVVAGMVFGYAGYKIFVPGAVPEGARREDLVFPRRNLMILVGIYVVAMIAFVVLYALGIQPFTWPMPKR